MSHAVYLFLVSDNSMDHRSEGATLWDVWNRQVEGYLEAHGDENNWYTILSGYHHNGERHHYVEEGSRHFVSDDTSTFDSMKRLALSCVAAEIRFQGIPGISLGQEPTEEEKRQQALTYEEYREELYRKTLAVLSWELSQLATDTWEQRRARDRFGSPGSLGMYDIERMLGAAHHMLSSSVAPFTTRHCTPYEYRCFDLRHDYDSTDLRNCAIISVDIHT